jgi:ElaA protein
VRISAVPFAALDPLTAYSLWKLRQDVFVVEQGAAYPDLDGRDLAPETRHVVMEDEDGVVLGCARVVDDGHTWRIGRVALHRTVRGQGYADAVMHTALQVCQERDVVLDAQTPLATWYGTHGFEVDGPEFLEDGIAHLPMRRPALHSPGTR